MIFDNLPHASHLSKIYNRLSPNTLALGSFCAAYYRNLVSSVKDYAYEDVWCPVKANLMEMVFRP